MAFGLVFAVNLLPAFGPPTWAVLVALRLSLGIEPALLVAAGALGAATGRATLALGARRCRGLMSRERLASLDVVRATIERRRAGAAGVLALFALSPVPSAQLFIAAGVTGAPIAPLTAAFFAGRTVSYIIYVSAAEAVNASLGGALLDTLRSPWGVAVQLVALAALVVLMRVDWTKHLGPGPRPGVGSSPQRDDAIATDGAGHGRCDAAGDGPDPLPRRRR